MIQQKTLQKSHLVLLLVVVLDYIILYRRIPCRVYVQYTSGKHLPRCIPEKHSSISKDAWSSIHKISSKCIKWIKHDYVIDCTLYTAGDKEAE